MTTPEMSHTQEVQVIACRFTWAAQYDTWLLIALRPKGVAFSFLSPFHADDNMTTAQWRVEQNCALKQMRRAQMATSVT